MSFSRSVDLNRVKELYSKSLKKHGQTPAGVGWGTKDAQFERFHVLLEGMSSFGGQPMTINELGCGYGALVEFLQGQEIDLEWYCGYDISEEMVNSASNKYSDGNIEFCVSNKILRPAMYSVASGIFNVAFDFARIEWEEYVYSTIRGMYDMSTEGFSFNMMSSYVDYYDDKLYYADPSVFIDYCIRNFSRNVSFRHGYGLYEWTITVMRER
ncbi:class I SAM-dependent methyltransferase [Kiloniella sp.]|uniref:class I SAM-dependent methyltransferase n=1 Tax=Kiloniella sp. TaxID=1938587 RepID=UPI003A93FE85